MTDALVTTQWLAEHLGAPDVRVVDATWFLPNVPRDPKVEYAKAHIPGAVYFDIDEIADDKADLPHMLPSPIKFSARMRRLGLGDGVRVIVYDNNQFIASARVWWMLRVFGHPDVAVLDGGLGKWRADGHPVDDRKVDPVERHFTASLNNLLVRELDQIRANLTQRREQVVDARTAARFHANEPEPRAGLRGGHIPGSYNVPYPELVAPDGTLRRPRALEQRFAEAESTSATPLPPPAAPASAPPCSA